MPILASTPIVYNGEQYPYYGVNLAISPKWDSTDVGGSVAMRLTPYRILQDGTIEKLDDQAKAVVYLDVFTDISNGDIQLGTAVNTIMSSIQQFILDKGI